MLTLSKLYITMENLRKLNLPIDERLKQEAAKLEEDLIRTEILPTLTEKIEPALAQVQRELVLVVDYVPGAPLKVSLSRKRNITDVLTDAVEIKPDPVVEHTEKKKGGKKVVTNPRTRLKITMPDGSFMWRCQFYYKDWQGVSHKKNKRGFKTEAEAEQWERDFLQPVGSSRERTPCGDYVTAWY